MMSTDRVGRGRCRIALYSPGLVSLGHMRRNHLIGHALASSALQPASLIIEQAGHVAPSGIPPGSDYLYLPALSRRPDFQYEPRSLKLALQEFLMLRSQVLLAALEAFEPDVLIVDFLPRGRLGELEPALKHLRASGRTRCVLGVRDILEAPESLHGPGSPDADEDGARDYFDAVRDYYDAVWVFADRLINDFVREYGAPTDVADKVHYTGYLDQRTRLQFTRPSNPLTLESLELPPGRTVLCLVGGGLDGAHVADTFARTELPPDHNGVILTGPYMPQEERQRLRNRAARNHRLRVLDFVSEPTLLLKDADCVIAMGGYNTLCEVLSFEKRALIVPRLKPREQLVRAERLRDMGFLDMLLPDQLTPRALSQWLARDLGPPKVRERLDLNGTSRLPGLLSDLLNPPIFPLSCEEVVEHVP